jgi:hypothetical protein
MRCHVEGKGVWKGIFQKHQDFIRRSVFSDAFIYYIQTAAHLYILCVRGKHKYSLRWLVDFESVCFSSKERTMLEIIMFSIYFDEVAAH